MQGTNWKKSRGKKEGLKEGRRREGGQEEAIKGGEERGGKKREGNLVKILRQIVQKNYIIM